MPDALFALLARRRFLPLFVSQFLGAANDNLFKNALVILVIYRLGDGVDMAPQVLVTVAGGLFILPFFLFSASAGRLADRFEKGGLMRWIKLAEVFIALLGAWSLLAAHVPGMLAVLFLFGLHSTFFGPLKYAVLPEYLGTGELIGGNALIEGGTFLAILLGTIAGGLLVLGEGGTLTVSVLMVAAAVGGFAASLFLPKAHPGNPAVRPRLNIAADTLEVLTLMRGRRDVHLAVLGISWFWLVGATYLTQLPAFAKDALGADEQAVTLMLTVFSVGIGLGSVLCGRLLKGELSARHVPLAALGMTVLAVDLWLAAGSGAGQGGAAPVPLAEFLSRPANWRVLADLLLMAVCGGIYIVPLYVIMQVRSDEAVRARIVAANNIMNAAFMVASAVAGGAMLAAGLSVPQLFLVTGLGNLAAAAVLRRLPPSPA
jgi:Major Facilitator Superfamily.